jgi:preprotein translocase subunit SecD
MRKHPVRTIVATCVVAYGLLLFTILMGRTPTLGLDLEGGISVNLQPVENGQVVDVPAEQLDQAIAIIRKRVDALGVAEPEVSRQGNTIQVQLPGARDQQQVLDTVGKTAELRFRPVVQVVGQLPAGEDRGQAESDVERLRGELNLPEGVTAQQVVQDEETKRAEQAPVTPPPAEEPAATTTTAAPATLPAPATTIDPTASGGGGRSASIRRQAETTVPAVGEPSAEPAADPAPQPPINQYGVDINDPRFAELFRLETQLTSQTTPRDQDIADQEVTLADSNGVLYRLGPTKLTGQAVETAAANLTQSGEWAVSPVFRGGPDGIDLFNAVAAACYGGAPECPAQASGRGQLAIVLDGEVLSAPSINESSFSRDQIQISGSFTEEEAKNLAVGLRFGSLPIELRPQQAEVVSATLGQNALRAGILTGLIGLVLVAGYLIAYYRLLGLATVGALSISASLLWVVMSNLNATLTLAGVVGIVVSIGISLDSSIVFFESLKEDVRNGATMRASVERSFSSAYATIIKADMSSLIGAVVLYWLSVGPVRGFAFYLGVATLLDLFAAFFFLRPAVVVLARSRLGNRPGLFGIPVDDLPAATRRDAVGRDTAGAAESVVATAGADDAATPAEEGTR